LPVYSVQGRNGGWALAGGGRTDLSGLTAAEVRALFLLAGPSSSATPELRAALRKLIRALPDPFRATAEAATRAVFVDRTGWDSSGAGWKDPPLLEAVQRAVVEGRQAVVEYVAVDRARSRRSVHPLGLALKGSSWYLVAGTDRGQRTFRVDRIRSFEMSEEAVVPPVGFDLADAWRSITAEIDELRSPAKAKALCAADSLTLLRWVFRNRMLIGASRADGSVEIELRGSNHRALAGEIAGFGGLIEVLDPAGVRVLLAEIARELGALYDLRR
jgi:predicted DNA-binding transcriptional regulator YafY